jgi:protein-S-isoprenylcysteine O-methyltransferase Ste14
MSLELLWEILTSAWVAGEVAIALATRTLRGQGNLRDRGTQIMLWIVIVASFTAGGYAKAINAADIAFSQHALRVAALALLVAGLAIRAIAIATLGRAFSANVAIRTAQTFQRSGFYSIVRHPSYLGLEIIFVAAALHTHNWVSMAIDFILPTLALLYRIRVEEAALLDAFGSEYRQYMKTTSRLIPGIY